MRTRWHPLLAEEQLSATLKRAAAHAECCLEHPSELPALVCDVVLAAQQAAALSLSAVGDRIPDKAGTTELLLRAANVNRLPAPFTLSLSRSRRQDFEALVTARNEVMHPRGLAWHIRTDALAAGLVACTEVIRHLTVTQPVVPDLVSPAQRPDLLTSLDTLEALADFLDESGLD